MFFEITIDKKFKDKIENLISTKAPENEWLDYKQTWHNNNEDLLIDILSFTNTYHNEDCYLIFGIADKTFEVVGVENDSNRKNQQNIINMLQNTSLSTVFPKISVISLTVSNKTIDVLIIPNTKNVPLFLTKRKRNLNVGQIFTRIGDTNTPKDRTADDYTVEKLYKKRLRLDTTIYERSEFIIEDVDNWTYIDEERKLIYNFDPNFYITMGEYDDSSSQPTEGDYFYWLIDTSWDSKDWQIINYTYIHFMYGQHKIFDISPAFLFDRGRGFITYPRAGCFGIFYYTYFLENSLDWKFMNLYKTAWNNSNIGEPFDIRYYSNEPALKNIVIYKNEEEKDNIEYIVSSVSSNNSLKILEDVFDTNINPTEDEIQELANKNNKYGKRSLLQRNISKAITKRLNEWRRLKKLQLL